jgi:hypothetical protein
VVAEDRQGFAMSQPMAKDLWINARIILIFHFWLGECSS